MSDSLIALTCIFLIVWIYKCNREGLVNKPNPIERENMVTQILNSKRVFGQSLNSARSELPWIDAVVYEDVRELISDNKFNKDQLNNILS